MRVGAKQYFLLMVQFSKNISKDILKTNYFDQKLTRPKLFQTKLTRRLRIFRAFANLFIISLL